MHRLWVRRSLRAVVRKLLLLYLSMSPIALPIALHAQCSICRDATAGTSPQMRRSLRRAIPILGIPAVLLFCGILFIAVRRDHAE